MKQKVRIYVSLFLCSLTLTSVRAQESKPCTNAPNESYFLTSSNIFKLSSTENINGLLFR
jgi:hypothetical protein